MVIDRVSIHAFISAVATCSPSLYQIGLCVFEERLPFRGSGIDHGETHPPDHRLPHAAPPIQLLHAHNHYPGLLVDRGQLYAINGSIHNVINHWLNLKFIINHLRTITPYEKFIDIFFNFFGKHALVCLTRLARSPYSFPGPWRFGGYTNFSPFWRSVHGDHGCHLSRPLPRSFCRHWGSLQCCL